MRALTLDVRADLFRVAARFVPGAALAELRPEMAGVRFEPIEGGGVVMVACDGEITMVVNDESGSVSRPFTASFPRGLIDLTKDLVKDRNAPAHAAAGRRTRLLVEDGLCWLTPNDGMQAELSEIDLPFPNWRDFVPPAPTSIAAPLLKMRVMTELSAVAMLLSRASGRDSASAAGTAIRFDAPAGRAPMVARFRDFANAFALIEPQTDPRASDWAPPEWVGAKAFNQARAA